MFFYLEEDRYSDGDEVADGKDPLDPDSHGCLCDFETDGDVDGPDLEIYAEGITGISVEDFEAEFGTVDCP